MKNHKSFFFSILLCGIFLLNGISKTNAQLYPGINVNSQLFTDNIWFFGTNWTGTGCPGVTFIKDNQDKWAPQNYSGKGQVRSWENSLSVSTPSCDGSFVFYTSHDTIYNSNHTPMKGKPKGSGSKDGAFWGNNSVADGLAACYIGDNKYYLFSCNICYFSNISLLYYEIDMSKDEGRGEISYKGSIESGMSESIELIPKKGTTNEYWLVYYHFQTGKMRVREVTPTGISNVVVQTVDPGPNLSTNIAVASNYSFMLKSNATYNQLVLTMPTTTNGFYIYDFDPATGQIRHNGFVSTAGAHSYLYNADFSPDGKYIYYSSYSGNNKMYQYDIKNKTVVGTPFEFTDRTTNTMGGGLKRGPDGRMYVGCAYTSYIGIIETPNLPRNHPDFKYTKYGINLGITYDNLPLSTGITPPAKDPLNISSPPATVPVFKTTTNTMPITVNVVEDAESNNPTATTLYVSSAFFTDPAKSDQGKIEFNRVAGTITFTPNISYPFTDGAKVNITFTVQDNGKPIPMCNSEQLEITVRTNFKSTSNLFNDNVWFFGANWSGPGCPAITFEKDGSNSWQPKDITATEKAKVNSWENSLSVSTPACDGSFVFYTSHDTIYNSNHVPMLGKPKGSGNDGTFWGHTSVADGLGACYIGNNKYFLFSSTTCYGVTAIGLRYYIIDMSKNGGLGEIRLPSAADGITDEFTNGVILSAGMSESLELIPVPGTSDEYWLIYHTEESNRRMVVRKVTPSGVSKLPASDIPSEALAMSYVLNSNSAHTMLSMVLPGGHKVVTYSFNPLTGQIAHHHTFDFPVLTYPGAKYGTIFSPNGRYLYATSWSGNRMVQYDLHTNTLVNSMVYSNISANSGEYGGGMKLGPDGKIYVSLSYTRWLGRIETPDLPINNAGFTYTMKAVELGLPAGTTYRNLPLSTGLTPPAIDPPGTNLIPILVPDVANAYTITPTTISPLMDDTYNTASNATELYLTKAQLANSADATKGTVTFNATAKTVTFTPNQGYTFTGDETIIISYTARDNQTPVGMCDNSTITLTMKVPQLTLTVPSPKQFNEGTTQTLQVCLPSGITAPAGGLVVTLSQLSSTAPMATGSADYTMPTTITIPAGAACASFNAVLNSDLLVEGLVNETLKIEAAAVNCKKGSDEMAIIDRTDGTILVELNPVEIVEGLTPGNATFTFRFKVANTNCPTKRVKVEYTVSGTAQNGTHYTITPNNSPAHTYINQTQTSTTVTVNAINDFIVDGGRDVKVEITNVTLE